MKKQFGFLEGYALLAVLAGAAVILIGSNVYSYRRGSAAVQAKWDKDTADKIIANDKKRSESVAFTANLVRENLEKEAAIKKLADAVKANGVKNETSKYCPTAPAGSVVVTPDRLRDLKALYK